jgi:hypothetical protein
MTEEVKKEYQSNIREETSSDIIFDKKEQKSLETKVGQIEIKIEALSEKLSSSINTKKWILASIVSIIALLSGAGFFIANLIFNYNQYIFEIQKGYNEQIIELRKEVTKEYEDLNSKQMTESFSKIKIQEEVINCFKNKKYWQFEDCLK